MRVLVLFLFFFSGATSLVYEVLWMRRLSLVFGHSIFSVSTVLTAFMAGLAIGSYTGGVFSDKKRVAGKGVSFFLACYGWLELFIGLWAVLSLVLLTGVESSYFSLSRAGTQASLLQGFIFLTSFLILLPPTTAMGATLPIFTQALVLKKESTGAQLSRLYGFNTLGACFGAVVGGVILLPGIGLIRSVLSVACVNGIIAALALTVANKQAREGQPESQEGLPSETDGSQEGASGSRLIPFVFGLSGFAGMVYQLGWTRALVLSIGSSTYSFSLILAAFLGALGLGSLVYRRLFANRQPSVKDLAHLQITIALSALLSTQAMGYFPLYKLAVLPIVKQSFGLSVGIDVCAIFLVLLLPTLCLGLTFPLVTHLYTSRLSSLGRSLGEAYSANTAGAIGGSFLSGFVLIPVLGAQNALNLAVALNLFGGLLLLLNSWREGTKMVWGEAFAVGLVLVIVVGGPRWNNAIMSSGVSFYYNKRDTSQPVYYRDGYTSTVSVGFNPGRPPTPYLRVNGKTDASLLGDDRSTNLMLGLVPLTLHPNPKRVGVIGFGSGQTLLAPLSDQAVEEVLCAELEPAVMGAKPFFDPFDEGLFDSPKLNIVEDDGRTLVMGSAEPFDLIISQPSNPWIAGIGNLFSTEFYQGCLDRLGDQGLMCQWLQLYALGDEDIQMVLRTFYDVFPYGRVFRTSNSDIILIGSASPVEIEPQRLAELWAQESTARWFYFLGMVQPEMFYGTYVADRDQVLEYLEQSPGGFKEGPVNSDDRPLLEFRAPLALFYAGERFELDRELARLVPPTDLSKPEIVQGAILGNLVLGYPLPSDSLSLLQKAEGQGHSSASDLTEFLLTLKPQPLEQLTLPANIWANSPAWAPHYFVMLRKALALPGTYGAVFQRALANPIPGSNPTLPFEAAIDALKRRHPEEARPLFELSAQHTKEDLPLVLGAILDSPDQWDEATLRKAMEINPYNTDTRRYLVQHLVAIGNTQQAMIEAEAAYAIRQDDLELLPILAELYSATGQTKKAQEILNQLFELKLRFRGQEGA